MRSMRSPARGGGAMLASAVLLLLASCAILPKMTAAAAAAADSGGDGSSTAVESSSLATTSASKKSKAKTKTNDPHTSAKPLLLLPAANAEVLASGAADHIVRAAFLGKGAPGAILVRGVPGYAAARKAALTGLAACARTEGAPMRRAAEWDENHGGGGAFSRATVAAGASGRLPPALDAACGPQLRPLLEALRAAADSAAAAALPRLDTLLGYDTKGFFASAAASEGSLDHFHVYQPNRDHAAAAAAAAAAAEGEGEGERASDDFNEQHSDEGSNDDEKDRGEGEGEGEGEGDDARPGLTGKGEHTDVGVAIVMTPALLVPDQRPRSSSSSSSSEDDDEEEDAFGSRGLTLGGRSPELPPDALVVMLGEAARSWLPPPPPDATATPPPAIAVPSHEMSLSLSALTRGGKGASRAWFGRMVLPPAETVHPTAPGGITFGEWHDGVNQAFGDAGGDATTTGVTNTASATSAATVEARKAAAAAVSCSPRRILADDASCGAGKVYCWLSCMDQPTGGCGTGTNLKCVQRATGKVWPDDLGADSHCFDCEPTCAVAPSPPPLFPPPAPGGPDGAPSPPPLPSPPPPAAARRAGGSTNEFCNDKIAPVSMFMDGFLAWSDPDMPCVAFLHRDFTITSPGAMVGAAILTILIGVAVEGLAAARRWRFATQDAAATAALKRGGPGAATAAIWTMRAQTLGMYTVQCSAGYLLMLISMTYHSALFAAVVAGLVVGHGIFNVTAPVAAGGGASACCQHVATVPGRGGGDGATSDDDDSSLDLATELMNGRRRGGGGGGGSGGKSGGGPKSCCGGGDEDGADATNVVEIRSDGSTAISPGVVHGDVV